MSNGTIKKLTDKGFGFIQGNQGDIFFHSSAVEGTSFDALYEGRGRGRHLQEAPLDAGRDQCHPRIG